MITFCFFGIGFIHNNKSQNLYKTISIYNFLKFLSVNINKNDLICSYRAALGAEWL